MYVLTPDQVRNSGRRVMSLEEQILQILKSKGGEMRLAALAPRVAHRASVEERREAVATLVEQEQVIVFCLRQGGATFLRIADQNGSEDAQED